MHAEDVFGKQWGEEEEQEIRRQIQVGKPAPKPPGEEVPFLVPCESGGLGAPGQRYLLIARGLGMEGEGWGTTPREASVLSLGPGAWVLGCTGTGRKGPGTVPSAG